MKKNINLVFAILFVAASCSLVSAQNISINTTGVANSTLSMLEVLQLSTTANTKGLHIAHSGIITGTGYGIWSEVSGASTTNIAGYFNATGGTNNYAGIFMGGYVGIGTTSPLAKLHVYGGDVLVENPNTFQGSILAEDGGIELYRSPSGTVPTVNGFIDFKNVATDDYMFRINWDYSLNTNTGGMAFQSGTGPFPSTNVMRMVILNSNGFVGIGNTLPFARLDVKGSGNTNATYGFGVRNSSDVYAMVVRDDGKVGIGITTPTATLEVVGTPSVTIKIVDGNQAAGKVLTSDAAGQASWQTFSAGCMVQYVQEFTANGTWTPTGATTVVDIEMWGGGGGGGGGMTGSGADNKGGAGGGSGAYIRINNVKVVAGSTYNITVGALGGGGAVNGSGTAGTASSFVGPASVPNIVAAGGPAGTRPACPVGGGLYSTGGNNVAGILATSGLYSMAAGGGGGSCGCAGACISAFSGGSIPGFGTGGSAGTGVNSGGGGGGGGAGRLNGGTGGNGSAAGAATAGAAAAANSAAGGGGGGGSSAGTAAAGGAGGAGYVKIIYWQ